MATPINAPLTSEIWHLSIEDLLEPICESPRLGGLGPFVINLSASSAPLSQPAKTFVPPAGAYVYQIQRMEDRRPRYRLRLGPFATEDEADAVLGVVRDVYPSALTATAESDDLRTIATFKPKPEKPPVAVPRSAAAAAPAAVRSTPVVAIAAPTAPVPVAAAPVAPAVIAFAPSSPAPIAPVPVVVATPVAPVVTAETPVAVVMPVAPVVTAAVPPAVAPLAPVSVAPMPPAAAPTAVAPPAPPALASVPPVRTATVPSAPVTLAARTVQSAARPAIPTLSAAPIAPTGTSVRSAAPIVSRPAPQAVRSEFMPAAVSIPVLSDSVEPVRGPVRRTPPPLAPSPPAAVREPVTPVAAIDVAPKAAPSTVKPALTHRADARDARPPSLESTQTMRALTTSELQDSAARWYVIQLSLSSESFDPDSLPNLDIFNEYRLYSVAGLDQGRIVHSLRLGFFAEQGAAGAVASYLAEFYEKPTVRRISVAERERFRDQRVEARKDIGATGRHAVIEITGERHIRDNRPRIAMVTPLAPAAAVSKSTAAPARRGR